MLSLKLFLFVCVSWNTCLLALSMLLWWWLVYWMLVGVLVAGTRSPTVRRPLSRKLSVLEILLAPECKYSERSITNYNWFIMSLNHFVRCALKVSEPWLSALLKESPIISIIERIHSVIERIPIISSRSRITPISCWEQLLHIKLYSGRAQQCWEHA